jgi:uncharacterized Zn finger protein
MLETATKSSVGRAVTAARPPSQRSRVGNGKTLIAGLDQRSADYREYADVVADLVEHLGSDPTVVERAIAEEAAGLVIWCRRARRALLAGEDFDVSAYTTAANSLRRLLADIGQEPRLKDVTPSLASIAAEIEAQRDEADNG